MATAIEPSRAHASLLENGFDLLEYKIDQTSLTDDEKLALALLLNSLQQRFANEIDQIILYGSSARGEVRFESDIDLLIILNSEWDDEQQKYIRELAFKPQLLYHCVFSLLILTPQQFKWHQRGSSLWLNILRDGIWLFPSSTTSLHVDHNAIEKQFSMSGAYTLTDTQSDEIRLYMERSAEELKAAYLLLQARMEITAISRCYYAVFYVASALLLTKGITRAKHSGVCSALGQYFIRTGEIPQKVSDLFESLQKERESADYNMAYSPGEKAAEERLQQATEFVDIAQTYLIENGFLDRSHG